MGIFQKYKLAGAKPGQGYAYFNPGFSYVCQCETIKEVKARSGEQYFCGELLILESNDPKLPVGRKANVFWQFGQDTTPGNIIALVIALSGLDPYLEESLSAEDWDAVAEAAIDEKEQALKGEKVRVETKDRVKKDKDAADPKNHYTFHEFYPVV